jgi:hypothetical protein
MDIAAGNGLVTSSSKRLRISSCSMPLSFGVTRDLLDWKPLQVGRARLRIRPLFRNWNLGSNREHVKTPIPASADSC